MIDVSSVLSSAGPFSAFTAAGQKNKAALHTKGRQLLKALATQLGLVEGTYEVRSNKAGPAVSGEVTLHGEKLYVQISEYATGSTGLQMMYRSCSGRKDYRGGHNNFVSLNKFAETSQQQQVVERMKALMA